MPVSPIDNQSAPKANTSIPIPILVMKDIAIRMDFGKQKYGTPLQANNGRDPLLDAYHESLDLAIYLRQELEERNGRQFERNHTKVSQEGAEATSSNS